LCLTRAWCTEGSTQGHAGRLCPSVTAAAVKRRGWHDSRRAEVVGRHREDMSLGWQHRARSWHLVIHQPQRLTHPVRWHRSA
jgi:hypothetical protein